MFRTNIRLFKVFGIPIELNITWFIVFALVAWSLVSLYFPTNYPGYSVTAHWVMGIVAALLLFTSVLLHETRPLLCGQDSRRAHTPHHPLPLWRCLAVGKESADPVTEIKIAAAGPGVSFVLMAVFGVFYVLAAQGTGLRGGRPGPEVSGLRQWHAGGLQPDSGFPLMAGRL